MKNAAITMMLLAGFGTMTMSGAADAQSRKSSARGSKSKENSRPNKAPAESGPRQSGDLDEPSTVPSSKTSKSESKAKSTPKSSSPFAGVGVELGYESTYGNGAVFHLYPGSFFELQGGVGYNTTGFKAGGGPGLLLWFTPSVALIAGAAYIYSQGSSGTVSLDANFAPDGGGAAEKVKATKKYTVSPASMAGAWLGMTFGLSDSIRLDIKGCYNKVISGNKVTFDDKIQYSKDISATNEGAFNKQFDDQANDLVQAGGPGVAFGLQFLF